METSHFSTITVTVHSDKQSNVYDILHDSINEAIYKARTDIAIGAHLSAMRAAVVRTETVTTHHWTELVPNGYSGKSNRYYASVILIVYINLKA